VLRHVILESSDLERSGRFYDSLLGPLGWRRHVDTEAEKAWGIVKPVFYIKQRTAPAIGGALVCFGASGIAAVKAAWEGGVNNGGDSESEPAQRPERGAVYYSAHLVDPDGHRIEVAVQPD
jgi:catechol 2,3-dioxygenase-like lactoylglutathione lyase family enzyme